MHLLVIALILVSGALSQNNNDNAFQQVGNTAFDSNLNPPTNFAAPVQQVEQVQQVQEQPKDIPAEQTVVDQPKQDAPQNTEIPKVPQTQGNNANNGNNRGQGQGNYRGQGQGQRQGGYRQGQGQRQGGYRQGQGQGNRYGGRGQGQGQAGAAICNPVTGIRARTGSIYSAVLQRMGVQSGNCGGNNNNNGGGAVNPVTGIQARRGSIYDLTLNAVGVRGGQAGVGLLGNNPLVQAINNNGGLIAAGDENTVLTSATAQAAMPGWAVAGIVILSVIMVATVAVMVQLVVLLRRS